MKHLIFVVRYEDSQMLGLVEDMIVDKIGVPSYDWVTTCPVEGEEDIELWLGAVDSIWATYGSEKCSIVFVDSTPQLVLECQKALSRVKSELKVFTIKPAPTGWDLNKLGAV